MKKYNLPFLLITATLFIATSVFSQIKIEAGDPPNPTNIPAFFKSKLSDIDTEINTINLSSI